MIRLRTGILSSLLAFAVGLPVHAGLPQNVSELAGHLEELGAKPLPGQTSLLVPGGLVGLFGGSPAEGDERPYVLVTAGGTSAETSLGAFAALGKEGQQAPYRLPPTFENLGRHIVVHVGGTEAGLTSGLIPLEEVAARLDLTGVTELNCGRLSIRAVGSSSVWRRLIEQTNIPLGFDLSLVGAPDLSSPRAAESYRLGVPGLEFSTDCPTAGAPNVGIIPALMFPVMIAAKVSRLEEPPTFQRVDRSSEANPQKSKRPSTGTIPDYTADVEGLLLEGVVEGGPAEEAGLQGGDVIVELAGSAITDVYTYADVLDTLEIDAPITVVFLRDDERLETTLTPQGR